MGPRQGIGYAHAAKGPRLRAQVVVVGESEGEKGDYSRIAQTAAVRRKQNMNENSVPAGVC